MDSISSIKSLQFSMILLIFYLSIYIYEYA